MQAHTCAHTHILTHTKTVFLKEVSVSPNLKNYYANIALQRMIKSGTSHVERGRYRPLQFWRGIQRHRVCVLFSSCRWWVLAPRLAGKQPISSWLVLFTAGELLCLSHSWVTSAGWRIQPWGGGLFPPETSLIASVAVQLPSTEGKAQSAVSPTASNMWAINWSSHPAGERQGLRGEGSRSCFSSL